jgi:hypothetical protein
LDCSGVGLTGDDATGRGADVVDVEASGGDLVEEWLERVVVASIDQGYVDIDVCEIGDGTQPAKPCTNHNHLLACHALNSL